MLPIVELDCALFLKSQISLVHQSGALQRVAGTFVPQIMMRHPPEFVIDKRKHRVQRLLVPGLPAREQRADRFRRKLHNRTPNTRDRQSWWITVVGPVGNVNRSKRRVLRRFNARFLPRWVGELKNKFVFSRPILREISLYEMTGF